MKAELADWETFYTEGKHYHQTAQGSVRRPEVFTPSIIENIVAMGIEKYFMAFFMHRGSLPRNHTLLDLLEEAQTLITIDPVLVESLTYMDSLQRICSVFEYTIIPPERSDVPRFIDAIDAVARLVGPELDSVLASGGKAATS